MKKRVGLRNIKSSKVQLSLAVAMIILIVATIAVSILNSRKVEDSTRIAVLPHIYSIISYAGNEFPIVRKAFSEHLRKQNLDAVVLTGDITATGTGREWHLVHNFLSKLNVSSVLVAPGNHEVASTSLFEQYKSNIGYLSKKITLNGYGLAMLNTSCSSEYKSNHRSEKHDIACFFGFGVTPSSIDVLNNLDPEQINLVFMHHLEFRNKSYLSPKNADQYKEQITNSYNKWHNEIVPILKEKKVSFVYTGDFNEYADGITTIDGINYLSSFIPLHIARKKSFKYFLITIDKDQNIKNELIEFKIPKGDPIWQVD